MAAVNVFVCPSWRLLNNGVLQVSLEGVSERAALTTHSMQSLNVCGLSICVLCLALSDFFFSLRGVSLT